MHLRKCIYGCQNGIATDHINISSMWLFTVICNPPILHHNDKSQQTLQSFFGWTYGWLLFPIWFWTSQNPAKVPVFHLCDIHLFSGDMVDSIHNLVNEWKISTGCDSMVPLLLSQLSNIQQHTKTFAIQNHWRFDQCYSQIPNVPVYSFIYLCVDHFSSFHLCNKYSVPDPKNYT